MPRSFYTELFGLLDLVDQLSVLLNERCWKVVTAESCTGGLVSAAITKRPGSSSVFDRGFTTYSNEAKMECLGVSSDTLDTFGAVSPETAQEMAEGALKNSRADISVSITGIAGPDGGNDEKPVGLVYFGYSGHDTKTGTQKKLFSGSREEVRAQAATNALKILISLAEGKTP